jgi:hypothetical protein
METERYLGDGVYATYQPETDLIWLDCRGQPELSTHVITSGVGPPLFVPGIALEGSVFANLLDFRNQLRTGGRDG